MEPIDVRGYSQPFAGTTTGLISLVAVRSADFKRLRLEKVAALRNDDVDVSFHSREDQKLGTSSTRGGGRRRKREGKDLD